MDSRNYVCDYNFDWVEKMQPLANKVWKGFDLFFDDIKIFILLEYCWKISVSINKSA